MRGKSIRYAQVTLDYTYKNEQLRITVLLNKSGRKYQYQREFLIKKAETILE